MKIFVTTRFEGFHSWPDAPAEVSFLRDQHRHIFHVRCWREVNHDDRDVEFVLWKREVEKQIGLLRDANDTKHWSCERWARAIGERAGADTVEVSEDGENGAVWFEADTRTL